MEKQILQIDMDGVVANFDKAIRTYCPDFDTLYTDEDSRHNKVNEICSQNRNIFRNLEPIKDAIGAVNILFESELFDIYFLSTPMWLVPESFTDKRIWLEEKFGMRIEKRLILSHRKDLVIGDYLIDDRIAHGVDNFKGEHIHFRTERFPDWHHVLRYLLNQKGFFK